MEAKEAAAQRAPGEVTVGRANPRLRIPPPRMGGEFSTGRWPPPVGRTLAPDVALRSAIDYERFNSSSVSVRH